MALTAEGAAINATLIESVLTMRATVYGRTGGTGPFNLVLKSDLACRLDPINRQPAATGAGRRELAGIGTLRYDAEYTLSETGVQIAVDAYPGLRWVPVAATGWPDILPVLGIVGKTVDVVRQL